MAVSTESNSTSNTFTSTAYKSWQQGSALVAEGWNKGAALAEQGYDKAVIFVGKVATQISEAEIGKKTSKELKGLADRVQVLVIFIWTKTTEKAEFVLHHVEVWSTANLGKDVTLIFMKLIYSSPYILGYFLFPMPLRLIFISGYVIAHAVSPTIFDNKAYRRIYDGLGFSCAFDAGYLLARYILLFDPGSAVGAVVAGGFSAFCFIRNFDEKPSVTVGPSASQTAQVTSSSTPTSTTSSSAAITSSQVSTMTTQSTPVMTSSSLSSLTASSTATIQSSALLSTASSTTAAATSSQSASTQPSATIASLSSLIIATQPATTSISSSSQSIPTQSSATIESTSSQSISILPSLTSTLQPSSSSAATTAQMGQVLEQTQSKMLKPSEDQQKKEQDDAIAKKKPAHTDNKRRSRSRSPELPNRNIVDSGESHIETRSMTRAKSPQIPNSNLVNTTPATALTAPANSKKRSREDASPASRARTLQARNPLDVTASSVRPVVDNTKGGQA